MSPTSQCGFKKVSLMNSPPAPSQGCEVLILSQFVIVYVNSLWSRRWHIIQAEVLITSLKVEKQVEKIEDL